MTAPMLTRDRVLWLSRVPELSYEEGQELADMAHALLDIAELPEVFDRPGSDVLEKVQHLAAERKALFAKEIRRAYCCWSHEKQIAAIDDLVPGEGDVVERVREALREHGYDSSIDRTWERLGNWASSSDLLHEAVGRVVARVAALESQLGEVTKERDGEIDLIRTALQEHVSDVVKCRAPDCRLCSAREAEAKAALEAFERMSSSSSKGKEIK